MARTSIKVKAAKRKRKLLEALAQGRKPDKWVRTYNRCSRCGRVRGYMRFFKMCRICVRELASRAELPGVKKSSW